MITLGPTAPAIGALLTAAGARNLTFADSRLAKGATLGDTPAPYDILIDLSAADTGPPPWMDELAAPRIVLALNCVDGEPGRSGAPGLHPMLALPGLLSAAVHRRITIDVTNRLAAAHALASLAPPGQLLPDPLDPRITATVHAAVTTTPDRAGRHDDRRPHR